jgi:cell division septum initiation protein DivIVA
VYLGLTAARARLRYDQSDAAVASVQDMLWDVALRIEEGIAAIAGRELADAQRALKEAMDRGASVEELERLMDEVQKALEKFLTSMMRELKQRGMEMPLDPNAQMLGSDELKKMLDQARELMRQGSMDAARQMMAELQRMLESLRGALARGRMDPNMREAQRTMGELRDIIRRQQKLLDESFRQSEEGGKPDTSQSREEQEAVRRQLGELMQKFSELMGEMPEGLGNAERAMREAEKALGEGKPGNAIGPQTRALEELRKGAQNGARGMAQRFGQGRQFGFGQGFSPGFRGGFGPMPGPMLQGLRPGNRDPFGRPIEEGGTGTATGNVKIPTESEMQRAREILRELRERAGDLWRPEFEREYIERLLRQF